MSSSGLWRSVERSGEAGHHIGVHNYLTFLALAVLVAVAPGPDLLLTLRNTVARGRLAGLWTMVGICIASTVQGVLAAAGLGAVIVHARPVFETIRWAGVAYLIYLGVSAIRAAVHGQVAPLDDVPQVGGGHRLTGLRQGFLCNITNPKVLVFNLAVLPQFAGADPAIGTLLLYALTLMVVGSVVLLAIVVAASAARDVFGRRQVRRGVDAGTGTVMLGFAAALAVEG